MPKQPWSPQASPTPKPWRKTKASLYALAVVLLALAAYTFTTLPAAVERANQSERERFEQAGADLLAAIARMAPRVVPDTFAHASWTHAGLAYDRAYLDIERNPAKAFENLRAGNDYLCEAERALSGFTCAERVAHPFSDWLAKPSTKVGLAVASGLASALVGTFSFVLGPRLQTVLGLLGFGTPKEG